MNLEQMTLESLMQQGIVPVNDQFQITEYMLDCYVRTYSKFKTNTDVVNLKPRQLWYARKLAGLSFIKLNRDRGPLVNVKEGLVYVIENPVYPNYLKIGMTVDLNTRLAQYQTYDPEKRFRVKNYEFVLNRRSVEQNVIASYGVDLQKSEWIPVTNSTNIIQSIRTNSWKINPNG